MKTFYKIFFESFCFSSSFIFLSVFIPGFSRGQSLLQADSLSAIRQYDASTSICKAFISAYPNRTYDHSTAWSIISQNALKINNYRAALHANENARNIREKLKVEDVLENYLQFGRIFLAIGDWNKAIEYLNLARLYPSDNPLTYAEIARLQAEAFEGKGLIAEAGVYYQNALENTIAELGPQHPESVSELYNLGVFCSKNRNFTLAEEFLLRARHTAVSPAIEAVLPVQIGLALGDLAFNQNKFLAARTWYLHSLDMLHTFHLHENKVLEVSAYLGLSRSDLATGQVKEAKNQIRKALEILYPEYISDDSDDFLLKPTSFPDNLTLSSEIWLQAALCLAPVREQQLRCLEQAMQLLEKQSAIFQPARNRVELMRAIAHVAAQALELCFDADNSSTHAKAYDFAESARYATLHSQTAPTLLSPDQNEHKTSNPIEEAKKLDTGKAVITFFEAENHLYLFAFDRASLIAKRLPTLNEIEGQSMGNTDDCVLQFLAAIHSGNTPKVLFWSNTFYKWLIEPAQSILNDKKSLIIVPTETLMSVPFEILSPPGKTKISNIKFHKIQWLSTRYELSFSLSGKSIFGNKAFSGPPIYIRQALEELPGMLSGIQLPVFSREIHQLKLRNRLAVWTTEGTLPYGEGWLSPIFASFTAGASLVWTERTPEETESSWSFSEFIKDWDQSKTISGALREARSERVRVKATAAPMNWLNGRIFQN